MTGQHQITLPPTVVTPQSSAPSPLQKAQRKRNTRKKYAEASERSIVGCGGDMNSFKDKINSFKGYDRVTAEQDRLQYRRKARKRFFIIAISSLLLLVIIVAAVLGTAASRKKDDSPSTGVGNSTVSQAEAIKAVCSVTQDPSTCFTSLSLAVDPGTVDPEQLFQLSIKVALRELSNVSALPGLLAAKENDTMTKKVLEDCQEMIETAIDLLNNSIVTTQKNAGGGILSQDNVDNLKTWLSSVLTNMDTCLDGFDEISSKYSSTYKDRMQLALRNSTLLASNSLAIASKIMTILQRLNIPIHRRLLAFPDETSSGFPAWLSSKNRKLLQDNHTVSSFDIVVAQDGTGTVKTIAEAINKVPLKSAKSFIIHVKAGKYVENIVIDKKRTNVVLVGESMDTTIISGSLNVIDSTPTFRSATFAVTGSGFMARDIGFENTAGAEKHQAVAVRVGSDRSAFFRCKFDGFQDTLYAHSNRQFYRDCTISGTIDFIFGNGAAVFQNCNILVKQPMSNQQNTVTAQGRTDVNQNTGISVLGCQITAGEGLKAPTYLGRPWKAYAVTVVMKTAIGGFLTPAGWMEWVSGTPPPSTIFYGEYLNTGAGAGTGQRVNWTGYHPAISDAVAAKYTAGSLIQGAQWLPNTGVSFQLEL